MSLLTRTPPGGDGTAARRPLRSPFALGALAAVQAVVGSLLSVVAPVLGVWIAATQTGATWAETLRLAADAWLLAHHAGVAVDGGTVGVVPLGLSLLPLAWCWAGGRRMAAALGLPAGAGVPGRRARRALVAFTGTYALLVAVVSLLAASPVARPVSGQALVGGAVLAAAAAGAAMLRSARTSSRPRPWAQVADGLRVPDRLRRGLPAAGVALGVWLAASSLLLAGAVALGWDAVRAAHDALAPGPVGGLGLVLLQLSLVPNLVVWAGAWLAGPGFSVGVGTSVTPWASELGAVPALPLLGALPPSGAMPSAGPLVLAVGVVAGAVAGTWLARRPSPAGPWWRTLLLDAATCGALAGAGAALLGWLASGSAGPGRLAEVGPVGWAVGLAVALEVFAGCAVAGLVLRLRRQPVVSRPTPVSWLRSRSRS